MKKILSLILIGILFLTLIGCEKKEVTNGEQKKSLENNDGVDDYPYVSQSVYDEHILGDKQVLETLEKYGDNPNIERDIYHYIYFDNIYDKNNFIEDVNSIGYVYELGEDMSIIVITKSTTKEQSVNSKTLEILNIAIKNNGTYDGWDTSINK